MIHKRLLTRWRREALLNKDIVESGSLKSPALLDQCNCILQMTQELLDQQLLKGDKKE